MLSKEQIKLFEKKGGKKEDYNFEEIVSNNKKLDKSIWVYVLSNST